MKTYFFNAKLFSVAVYWKSGKASGISINPDGQSRSNDLPPEEVAAFFRDLEEYVQGRNAEFTLPIDWSRLSGFARKVSRELVKTRPGDVLSYGELARRTGNEKASRAVGRVMAGNPFPIVIPCHRVIGKSGSLTGFGPGLALKEKLLDLERRLGNAR